MLYHGIESAYATHTLTPLTNGQQLLKYWEGFNAYAHSTPFVSYFALKRPQPKNWYDTCITSKSDPLFIVFDVGQHRIKTSIYTAEKEDFYALYDNRGEIEEALGFSVEWQFAPGTTRSCINIRRDHVFDDRLSWQDGYQWYIDMAMRFQEVFPRYC